MSRFNGKTFSRTPSASSRADAEPPQSFEEFKAMRTKSGGGDPHALAKVRIKSQIESAYAQKRMERLSHLSFFVERAFDLAVSTGEVVIGRDRDELADDGMKHVTNSLKTSTGKFITSLNVPSHHIGKAGATQLAQALQAAPKLVTFNIANNIIGSEGADVLAKCFTSVPSLENLDLSENRIGPAFPPNLVLCTSLKKLDIRHNKLAEIPCALGMHPKLALLDLAYNNLRMIPDSLVRAGCVPILRELVDQAMHQACVFGQHNQDLQPITGVRPDQKVVPGAQNYCYALEDLMITVDDRWNQDTDWLAGLLEKHTTLRGINDLHEWPVPPVAVQTTWDLNGRLFNPLYECVFVRNCLMRSPLITSIDISNNDLRGRCAICLAQAIESSRSIVSIDVNNCRWDEGIQEFGVAVRACGTVERLNLLTLGEDEVDWDLRGRLNSVIDVAFVASRLESQGTRLLSLDISGNTLTTDESLTLARAVAYTPHLTFLNGLYLGDTQDRWDLRKRLINGRTGDDGLKSFGTLPIEIEFMCNRLRQVFFLADVDLSSNDLRDEGMIQCRAILNPLRRSLTSLALNHNGLTKASAPALKETLHGLTKLKILRLSDNHFETEGTQIIIEGINEGNHRGLEELYLDDLGIGPLIPSGIEKIISLRVISMRYNILKILSTDLCELPRLSTLLVDGNPIEIPDPVLCRRGFNAIMQFLRAAHRLAPLRQQHLEFLQEDVPRDIRPHIMDVAEPEPGSQHSKKTMADRHKHVQAIARETCSVLEMPKAESSFADTDSAFSGLEAMDKQVITSSEPSCVQVEVLQRHGVQINCAVFYEGIDVIATCSNDMTIKLWQPSEVDQGRWTNSATLRGHLGTVSGVTFSPKGLPLMLASGSMDGTVRLWTAETLEEEGNAYKWTCAQILGNAHIRQKLRRRGKKIQATGHRDEVRAVAFRKKGEVNLLASGSMDETVRIWGLKTKDAEISEEELDSSDEEDADMFSDAAREKLLRLEELHRIFDCFCSQEDPGKLRSIAQIEASKAASAAAAAAAAEKANAKGSTGTNAVNNGESNSKGGGGEGSGAAKHAPPVISDASKAFGGQGERGKTMDMSELLSFYRWSGLKDCVSKSLVTKLFKDVNGRNQTGHGLGDDVHELDWEEFIEILHLVGHKCTYDVEGKRRAVGMCQWTEYGSLESICGVILEGLGTGPPSGEEEGNIDWACLSTLKGHKGGVTCLAWLPSSDSLLATGSYDEHIMIWMNTVSRGRSIWTNVFRASGHNGMLTSLSFGRNAAGGIVMASSSTDESVMLWRVQSREVARETLDGQVKATTYLFSKGPRLQVTGVRNLCFRDDSAVLAMACDDSTVRLWKHDDGDAWIQAEAITKHNQSVNWVAFGGSREPVLLATCSSDGSVKLHDTSAFSEWQDRSNLEGIRRVPRKQAARFPPRVEGMTFHRRPVSLWKFSVAQSAMDHITARLESDTDLKHEVSIKPNHGGRISIPCQEGQDAYDIRIEFHPKTVWNKLLLGISAISISSEVMAAFGDAQVISPIVEMFPRKTMFRQTVKVCVPHNCVRPDQVSMVYFSFGEWHTVETFKVTATHCIASIESFQGPMACVFTGDSDPVEYVYCIPLTADGRPLSESVLTLGQETVCHLEIIPCSSVQKTTVLSDAFRSILASLPVYKIVRGVTISAVHVQLLAANRGFQVECRFQNPTTWEGNYALLRVHVAPVPVSGSSLSPSRASPSSRRLHTSLGLPSVGNTAPSNTTPTGTPSPSRARATTADEHGANRLNVSTSTAMPGSRVLASPLDQGGQRQGSSNAGSSVPAMSPWTGNISRTTSSHHGDTMASAMLAASVNDAFLVDPQNIFIGFSLLFEDDQRCQPMLVKPVKVTVQAQRLAVKLVWGGGSAFKGVLGPPQILVRNVIVNNTTTLLQVRDSLQSELPSGTAQAFILRKLLPVMFFKTHEGKRVRHNDEGRKLAREFLPNICLTEMSDYTSRAATPQSPILMHGSPSRPMSIGSVSLSPIKTAPAGQRHGLASSDKTPWRRKTATSSKRNKIQGEKNLGETAWW